MVERPSSESTSVENKTNNNTKVRPGATEFIHSLNKLNYHVAFYSGMNINNLKKIVGFVLDGKKTGLSTANVTLVPGNVFVMRSGKNYFVDNDKQLLINYVNNFRKAQFDYNNTIVIDYQDDSEIYPGHSIIIDKYIISSSDKSNVDEFNRVLNKINEILN